jgi:hypothetical protein
MQNVPNHKCVYSRLHEAEPSVSKHVADIRNSKSNINLEMVHFGGLYCIIILHRTVQKKLQDLFQP